MTILIGTILALAVGLFATWIGLDRDRALYPAVMMVIASYYVLFAVIGGSTHAVMIETLMAALFLGVAVAGFKWSLWLVVGALVVHGIFDFFHDHVFGTPGVPSWWPAFCLSFDATAAGYLAWRLSSSQISPLGSKCAKVPSGRSHQFLTSS